MKLPLGAYLTTGVPAVPPQASFACAASDVPSGEEHVIPSPKGSSPKRTGREMTPSRFNRLNVQYGSSKQPLSIIVYKFHISNF